MTRLLICPRDPRLLQPRVARVSAASVAASSCAASLSNGASEAVFREDNELKNSFTQTQESRQSGRLPPKTYFRDHRGADCLLGDWMACIYIQKKEIEIIFKENEWRRRLQQQSLPRVEATKR